MPVTLGLTHDRGPHAFGLCRVWGTIGFFVVVASWIVNACLAAVAAAYFGWQLGVFAEVFVAVWAVEVACHFIFPSWRLRRWSVWRRR